METTLGRKCPECGSFVMEEAKRCPVCGHETSRGKNATQPLNAAPEPPTEKCPQCRKELTPGTQFCAGCGSAVGQSERREAKESTRKEPISTSGKNRSQKRRFIRFDWIKTTPGYTMLNTLDLDAGIGLFDGFAQWEGYGFFLYQNQRRNEILIRKFDPLAEVKLFRKCERTTLVEPSTEIYIGAMGVELVGSTPEKSRKNDSHTVANVTQYVGPGEKRRSDDSGGKPAPVIDSAIIRFLDAASGPRHIEAKEKLLIGRSFLAGQLDVKEEALRDFGISQEHVYLTAGEGQWLVEPVKGKPVYIEIKETPVFAREGEIFRWMFTDCFGEFKIRVAED
jgi:RNA polymerase subunit RPABC4/transcription elongation factor Spt4